MAYVFYKAIAKATDEGLIEEPNKSEAVDNPSSGGSTCEKSFGDGVSAGGLTQGGSGQHDGIYQHESKSMGSVLTIQSKWDRDQFRFANLYSRDQSDITAWYTLDSGDVVYGIWRNTGNNDKLFVRIGDMSVGDNCKLAGVHFADFNGDGLDDFICIGKDGAMYVTINQGEGTDSKPPSFKSVGNVMPAKKGYDQGRVRIGDIDGDGRADYVYMEHTKEWDSHRFEVKVWKNNGSGGTKMLADGNKYCDMRLYPNKGLTDMNGQESFRGPNEIIFDPEKSYGRKLHRRDLHLADFDGDGACDIIHTNPDNGNRVEVWINQYPKTKKWDWKYQANPAPDLNCPEKKGVGIFDNPVGWADISGNGRDDYLCIEKDGRTHGWIHNKDGSWERISQFKRAEGADRANIQWADVNGDGRDDMIWVEKFTGDGHVYYNMGRGEESGSQFVWRGQGALYQGAQAGACTYYPDLDGDGRADMHVIKGSYTNQAETWFNPCGSSDNKGDDAGGVVDPNLPKQPAGDDDADPDPSPDPNPGDGDGADEGISTDGECGAGHGNCLGTTYGSCCGTGGICGGTTLACGTGCNKQYGICYGGSKAVKPNEPDYDYIDWPEYLEDAICTLDWMSEDPKDNSNTWLASGAATWFLNFLHEYGAADWSTKVFMRVMSKRPAGGTTIDCVNQWSSSCNGPGEKECHTYYPPSAFFVHLKMGHLYGVYNKITMNLLVDSISVLSSHIKSIVTTYGTPEEDNSMILNMIVGVLTSLAGISGGIDQGSPSNPLGKYANPLTFLAGIFTQAATASRGADGMVDSEALEDKLEDSWGKMFSGIVEKGNKTVTNIFSGTVDKEWDKDGVVDPINWIWSQFANDQWINANVAARTTDIFAKNVKRYIEFATVRAMKTENKAKYRLLWSVLPV